MAITGIKPSSNIGSALVSAMYDRSSELGLYQTYTSAHPFDTLVAGMGDDNLLIGNVNLQETEATFHCTNSFLL